jgi:hypothetical protein
VVGQPVEVDVDQRIQLQHVLEHDPRPAQVVPVHQGVDEEERVTGTGVPGEHHHGVRRSRHPVVQGRPRRAVGDQPQGEQPPRHAHEHVEQQAQHVVVRRPVRGGVQPAPEAAAHPQHRCHRQTGRLQRQVDQGETQHPQRAPAPRRPHRRDHRHDHEHRQQDEAARQGSDDQRAGEPAYAAGWQHLRPPRPRTPRTGPGSHRPRRTPGRSGPARRRSRGSAGPADHRPQALPGRRRAARAA